VSWNGHSRQVDSFAQELISKRIEIIGVPMDLGADRRGVDLGPAAIRYARLHDRLRTLGISDIRDHGNLVVPSPENASTGVHNAKYFNSIRTVCDELADLVEKIVDEGGFPLVLGGDHSIAMGTLAGLARARKSPPSVLWFDAHADINTPQTSPSGNVHGMPVALSFLEKNIVPERTVLIGLRDLDAGEKRAIYEFGVHAYSMSDIDRLGMPRVIEEALELARPEPGTLHVSFDVDGLDPNEAPGTGTAVRGGISYREAHLAMEIVAVSGALGSMEVTEVNPILDDRNRTAKFAVELILSALGKAILPFRQIPSSRGLSSEVNVPEPAI
jgi:arginase